jgi:hypothetical protein
MAKKRLLTFLVMVFLILSSLSFVFNFNSISQPLAGNTLYVGSTSTYKTIQDAVDNASSGDTIIVANGTYVESVKINKTLILIGNSTTDCKIVHNFTGSGEVSHFSTALNVSAPGVNITGFNITVTGPYNYGIFSSSSNTRIFNNNIKTIGVRCHGILLYLTSNHILQENNIETHGFRAYGIFAWSSSYNDILNNTITTNNESGYGISLLNSDNDFAFNNTILTLGLNGNGIQIWDSSHSRILGHTITTTGQDAYGLYIRQNCMNNTIEDNRINTSNQSARGIHIQQITMNYFTNNTVGTAGQWGYGIYIVGGSNNNWFTDNTIGTTGDFADGVFIVTTSDDNNFHNNKISCLGQSSYGFQIDNANYNNISECEILTSGSTSPGIYVDGAKIAVVNTTISTGAASNDLVSLNDGNMTVINSSFTTVFSTSGVVQVKNYLDIQVYYNDSLTPIKDADIKITDNNYTIYSTAVYGGSDQKTDVTGRIEDIIVLDRWYYYSNTAIENTTNISVEKTHHRTWSENRININMSTSHSETFVSSDIRKPPIPKNLTIRRIPGTNSLNISWDQNPDTVTYTVWAIKACNWAIIANVTHPQNWTLDENIPDNTYHYYRIEAWDAVGLGSGLSGTKDFNLTDITPPQIPVNLRINTVPDGDALNISWDINLDDTKYYEVWWENPSNSLWEKIANISQPQNSMIWSDELLINGSSYKFRLRAWDKVDLASGFTTPIIGIHRDYIPPYPPYNLKAIAVSDTAINLSWSHSMDSDVVGHYIYSTAQNGTSEGPYFYKATTTEEYYIVPDLLENMQYFFILRSYDEANNTSPDSNWTSGITLAIPPRVPTIDKLSNYTNNETLNLTGTADPGTKVLIYRFLNNLYIKLGEGFADNSGKYGIEISLETGPNQLTARARDDAKVYSDHSEVHSIILDQESPFARAGPDININEGEILLLNGSLSSDNYGISSYEWKFNYNGTLKIFTGKLNLFKFEYSGIYAITLTVTDLAGNIGSDTFIVNVSKAQLQKPFITETTPIQNTTNYLIINKVTIKFSLPMDQPSVISAIDFIPDVDFTPKWDNENKTLVIKFDNFLAYNTSYILKIGNCTAQNGENLIDAPFILRFTTEKKSVTYKDQVLEPKADSEFEPGHTITVSGKTEGFVAGTIVNITIGDRSASGTISSDGSYSIEIKLPFDEGNFYLNTTIGEISGSSIPIEIKFPDKPTDGDGDDGEDTGILGLGSDMDLIIFAIIVIIIILLIILAQVTRRKRREQIDEEEFFIDEQDEEEEDEEEEELEDEDIEEDNEDLEDEELTDEDLEDVEELEEEELVDDEIVDEELIEE